VSISLLILAAACCSLWLPKRSRAVGLDDRVIDWAWFLVMAIAGVLVATDIHATSNPYWFPVGQDWREFVVLGLDIQSGGAYHPVPQRYPFYPWLAVQLAELNSVPVHIALMQINIIAGGLIPAAIYRLGLSLGPRPIALMGGWLSLHIPTVGAVLGPPTDYLFHTLIHIAALSAGIRALRSECVWRWLGFGVALALLMASNMKSLVFLLVAAPLVGLSLIWMARRSFRLAFTAGTLWLIPMVVIWQIYAGIPRWVTEAYTLEYNVYRTQVVVARAHGRTTPLPTDLGWHPSDEKQRGYWGVGRPGAWSNLDKALTFLARGPQHNIDRSLRFRDAVNGLTRGLHLPTPSILLLGVLGCVSTLRRRATDSHLGPTLATCWLLGITGAHFLGLMSTHYIPRYALVLLAPAPLLILAGVGFRKSMGHWLVLLAAFLTSIFATQVPGKAAIHASPEVKEGALNPHPDFWAVRDGLTAQDTVIDLTGNRLLPDLWATSPASIRTIWDEEKRVDLRGTQNGRRILVMPGALNLGDPVRKWTGAAPGRLKTIRPYVVEDTQPTKPLTLQLTGLGG